MVAFIKKSTAGFLTIAILAPSLFLSLPQQSHAQGAGAAGGVASCLGSGYISGALSAGASLIGLTVPVSDAAVKADTAAQTSKDCVLDGLVILIREVMIANITRSIVNWINSGFEGKPAFVQNLNRFLLNIADEVAGAFIEGSELAFLCSPFDIDVRIALALDYYSNLRDRTACTLTGALDNIEDAFDYKTSRGFDSWFDISINPNNNALGAFTSAQSGLFISIQTAQETKTIPIAWGDGFLGVERCYIVAEDDRDEEICDTVTPGRLINDNLSEVLGSGFRQLELADEINEIIGALLSQLVKQIFTPSGLVGLSDSSYGRSSYLDQTISQSQDRTRDGLQSSSLSTTNNALSLEEAYLDAKKVSLQRLTTSENLLSSLQACYAAKIKDTTLGTTDRTIANERIATASSTIASSITPFKTAITNDIAGGEVNIQKLVIVNDNIAQTTSLDQIENVINTELDPLLNSGTLHSPDAFIAAQQQRVDLGDILNSLDEQTNKNIATCNTFPNIDDE